MRGPEVEAWHDADHRHRRARLSPANHRDHRLLRGRSQAQQQEEETTQIVSESDRSLSNSCVNDLISGVYALF